MSLSAASPAIASATGNASGSVTAKQKLTSTALGEAKSKKENSDSTDPKTENSDDQAPQETTSVVKTDSAAKRAVDSSKATDPSRFEQALKDAQSAQSTQMPAMPPPQNQGLDPAMMAALASKPQEQPKQSSGGGGQQSSPQRSSGSEAVTKLGQQMNDMNKKFTAALEKLASGNNNPGSSSRLNEIAGSLAKLDPQDFPNNNSIGSLGSIPQPSGTPTVSKPEKSETSSVDRVESTKEIEDGAEEKVESTRTLVQNDPPPEIPEPEVEEEIA